uniref:Dethiobiotin synthase n=1 Tax=Aplanochytrium stocchinoi TaxID=215587 RepID=A0A7S3PHZ9_9STRA|mmetsp:Transcript_17411/g.21435  ORF Transcript_17411/g.21435 Transcript_17411/m.21435 type:complete len:243 (-) Transcript_17411:116-844(-)|eukprot:CAMPEP_0204824746 /NCGR_PEP_ID=MMETSP1346-20131115/2736_1 /ASSEMBLY_ACC=CAM_ASM_000771 /TAXON_ID=215587 /ORGANISM="Aplanochytrium stocchinoi, Strain GSBS06" /LENGTH=242 /DNA_ID=CAMNT_0051952067 /DNA_START=187 /DNA_END=915 /DNA_ORIENTATION=-
MTGLHRLGRLVVFGANTDVGKTVVSTGIVRAALKNVKFEKVVYCKPLQTGTIRGDSDVNFVKKFCSDDSVQNLVSKELFSWPKPLSPHVAAVNDPNKPTDDQVCESIDLFLSKENACVSFVETAGGVLSPGVQGTPQADTYRSYLPEVILVGDGRLGGISTTLCALQALQSREYNIRSIVMIEDDSSLGNSEYIASYCKTNQTGKGPTVHVASLPGLPHISEPLYQWYNDTEIMFQKILDSL